MISLKDSAKYYEYSQIAINFILHSTVVFF